MIKGYTVSQVRECGQVARTDLTGHHSEHLAFQLYRQLKESKQIIYVAIFVRYEDQTSTLLYFETKGTQLI